MNDLIALRLKKENSLDAIALKIDSLPESRFKNYAKTIIATVNPAQTFYEYFSNRKKLIIMHAENKEFDDCPNIISSLFPGCCNAFWPDQYKTDDAVRVHVTISETLTMPSSMVI